MLLTTGSSRSLKAPGRQGKKQNTCLSGDTEIERRESLLPKAISFRERKIPISVWVMAMEYFSKPPTMRETSGQKPGHKVPLLSQAWQVISDVLILL